MIRRSALARLVPSLAWLALPLAAGTSAAQEPAPGRPAPPRTAATEVRLTLDNDHFNFWQAPGERPDFGYTHGTELAIRVPRAGLRGRLARALGAGGDAAIEVRVRQDIYSPWRLPADRPYAGWLGLSAGVSRTSERGRRELMLTAGVTGPPSLAAAVQRSMHRAFDQGAPPDWSGQLPFEPGIGLEAATAARAFTAGRPDGPSLSLGGLAQARLATHALSLRLGVGLVAGWSPPGLWPGAGRNRSGPSLHVRLEPRLDLIGRDEFLDGTLFSDRSGPGTRHAVAESRVAAGAGWNGLSVEYAVMRRSIEFEGQPKPHTYSSLSATWSP